jgi:hypothetical protein
MQVLPPYVHVELHKITKRIWYFSNLIPNSYVEDNLKIELDKRFSRIHSDIFLCRKIWISQKQGPN